VDSFHTLSLADDPSGIAELPGEKLFFVQLADAPKLAMDVLSWSRHFRNFPGQGDLDVTGFTRAVLCCGYMGPLSLEVFNDDFRAAPARLVALDGLRSLILNEAEASGHAALPAPPTLDGIEFLEFTVDETAGQELADYLARLGFRHAGRHRSKTVDLYRQGRINLVLNAELDSAAAEHFQLHGPSVCAMAIRVDDVARTLDRARALLCPVWYERIGTGERRIPAVRAPDGTLVYLVESERDERSFWADDFDLKPGGDGLPALADIDHMVMALPAGQMATYLLFWRGLFGLQPQPLFDTADPYGLVHSRALVSVGEKVCLVLNASESRRTATSQFVSAYAGAGVHHVAFGTTDIVQTAERLAASQVPRLSLPANYYDDLSARWNLDDKALDALQRHRLLYDCDGEGEFHHLYTATFQDRFFFEVIQRRGAYAGFGAANASVRAAAQAREHPATTDLL